MQIKLLIIWLMLTLGSVSRAYNANDAEQFVTKAYQKFCSGDFQRLRMDLASQKDRLKDYIPYRLLVLNLKEAQLETYSQAKSAVENVEDLSESDRLIFADILLSSRIKDWEIPKRLLNFRSENRHIESFRKVFESNIDLIEGNQELAIQKRFEAHRESERESGYFLSDIFSLVAFDVNGAALLEPYVEAVKKRDGSDPLKHSLLGWYDYAVTKGKTLTTAIPHFERAYKLCPYDQILAVDYAALIFYEGRYKEAEEILSRQRELSYFYSPYMDFILTLIYSHEGDKEKENTHYQRLIESRKYFSADFNLEIDRIIESKRRSSYRMWIVIVTLLLALILSMIFMASRRDGKRRSKRAR